MTRAKGSGYDGDRHPYNGGGKFPWKVEWAAKWPTVGVVFETAGKDHFTRGGSRDIAVAISDEIFGFTPPLPSYYKNPGNGYEFFTIGGKKMSTSHGRGVGFADSLAFAQGNILRYLLISTRPRAQLDFDPFNGQDLILLYDRYDKTERVYHGEEKLVNPHDVQKQKRIYALSATGKMPKKMLPQIPLTLAGVMVQISPSDDDAIQRLVASGHLPMKLYPAAKQKILGRLSFSRRWIKDLAPDKFRFALSEETHVILSEAQKELVRGLITLLEKDCSETELHNGFYSLCKQRGISPADGFSIMYTILINKPQGPRLASFILMVGREKIRNTLQRVL